MAKISIMGAGSWGTALAVILSQRGHLVTLWSRHPQHSRKLRQTRRNASYLPDILLPDSVEVVEEIDSLKEAEVVLWTIPSAGLKEVAQKVHQMGEISHSALLVSCVKGIEHGTGRRMSQILKAFFPDHSIAALSGPNHAEEVARGIPAASVIGADSEVIATRLQRLLATQSFRIYTSTDLVGIELGGAFKNVFALAAGVCDGLGLGDNSKAALVTRSLTEMVRLGVICGGHQQTFFGLSGIGDLMVTCFSRHSRNRRVGERLAKGEPLDVIVNSMPMVAEGIPTARSSKELAAAAGVETPIIDEVYAMLYESASPDSSMRRLLDRELRKESG